MKLKEYVEASESDGIKQEYAYLQELAQVGRDCRKELEEETARLGVAMELGLNRGDMALAMKELSLTALKQFHDAMEKKLEVQYGGGVQMEAPCAAANEDAFLI